MAMQYGTTFLLQLFNLNPILQLTPKYPHNQVQQYYYQQPARLPMIRREFQDIWRGGRGRGCVGFLTNLKRRECSSFHVFHDLKRKNCKVYQIIGSQGERKGEDSDELGVGPSGEKDTVEIGCTSTWSLTANADRQQGAAGRTLEQFRNGDKLWGHTSFPNREKNGEEGFQIEMLNRELITEHFKITDARYNLDAGKGNWITLNITSIFHIKVNYTTISSDIKGNNTDNNNYRKDKMEKQSEYEQAGPQDINYIPWIELQHRINDAVNNQIDEEISDGSKNWIDTVDTVATISNRKKRCKADWTNPIYIRVQYIREGIHIKYMN
ncbi:MAG: hypothetical protein EZS28_026049 [Streblomastix strix]|uniref:Uncharacterized protein n=1 Tax=Streblomastix strix TaxID=222440 RepID=A0A5J4V7L0_9EUKA|nr:MAG: hypothetical protein EZS28_026049 [Streblomastix strix]